MKKLYKNITFLFSGLPSCYKYKILLKSETFIGGIIVQIA